MQRFVATVARLLEAAERYCDVVGVVAIHIYRASAQSTSDAMCRRDIARPHCRDQTVDHIVRDAERFLDSLEGQGRENRPEDLLARDLHPRRHGIEDGGLDVEPAAALAR